MNPERDATGASAAMLLGRWRLVRADAELDFAPDVSMEFLNGGRLMYEFTAGGVRHLVNLLYRVDGSGDTLRTDNPAAPHERSTHFHFGAGEVLIFDFAGPRAWFVCEL